MPPEAVLDRQIQQRKADANGEPRYSIELVRIGAEDGEVLSSTFPGTLGHRREIALPYPSARGASGRGEACDFCQGHHP
jgi:hypothetical protein